MKESRQSDQDKQSCVPKNGQGRAGQGRARQGRARQGKAERTR